MAAPTALDQAQELVQVAVAFVTGNHVTFPKSGRFYLGKQIGEGGYSFVYICKKACGSQKFAIKKQFSSDDEGSDLICSEIRAFTSLRHKYICPLIDHTIIRTRGGGCIAHMLFPYAEQGTLRTVLNACQKKGASLSVPRILHLFSQILEGVEMFHQNGLVHADLKPENILIDGDGCPLLTDLGSVRQANFAAHTRTQAMALQEQASRMSSLPYRAPELFDVVTGSSVDARTDVWALGCVLFAARYYYSPFECQFRADGVPVLTECSHVRVLSPPPQPPSPLSPGDEIHWSLVQKLLTPSPQQRPFLSGLQGVRAMTENAIVSLYKPKDVGQV